MKKYVALICLLFTPYIVAQARELKSETDTATTMLQMRVGATFTKTFAHNVSLFLEEELRIALFDYSLTAHQPATPTTYFSRAYTTIGLEYEPIEYLKIGADYTLKLYGQKGWSDPNKYLRHRFAVALTGQYNYEDWRFSFRERLVMDLRTDSVNPLEQPRCEMQLRHRLQIAYQPKFRPYRPYLNLEIINTLNQPTWNPPFIDADGAVYKGGQYLSDVRTTLGIKYRLNKRNSLDFYYRFDASWAKDYNITRNKGHLEIINETAYTHIIGITYEFDW